MKFFDRLSNGWKLGKTSLNIIKENPSLLIFPLISGMSLIFVSISFFGGGYLFFGGDALGAVDGETVLSNSKNFGLYVLLFVFYLVNYFIIVFFNIGLVHCAKMIFEGKETSASDGLRYAQTRIGSALAWAFLAATVGMILKTIQERAGALGGIITGIIGVVWGIATFFVVPVLAYEDVSPIEAVKRSALIMKEKWGESIGANFSFGLFTLIGIFLFALPLAVLISYLVHPIGGFIVGILAFVLVQTVVSAANTVFLAAVYQHVKNEPTGGFDGEILDDVFMPKAA